MKKEKKSEWKGALKAILIVALLFGAIGIGIAAWDDAKSTSDALLATEWNAQVTDQKNRTNSATFVVAASDSRITSTADYVCDGTADQAEINSAIAALPEVGGEVKLLEGTYNLSSTINLTDHTTLSGCGWSTILKAVSTISGSSLIPVVSLEDIVIKNLCLDGNSQSALSGFYGNSSVAGATSHIRIENCEIKDFLGYPIWFGSGHQYDLSHHIWILNNWIHDGGYGAVRPCECDTVVVENNLIENCGGGNSAGICLCCLRNGIIRNNIIKDSTANRGGIWIGTYYFEGYNILIDGNTIINCGQSGIEFIGDGGNSHNLTNVIITNNIIDGGTNTVDGISCDELNSGGNSGTVKRIFIENNIVENCSAWGLDFGSISGTVTEVFIRNNLFEGTTGNLQVAAAITEEIIKDNKGYNPVGVSSISVGASVFTYTAGASTESVYVSGGTVSDITKGGNDFGLTSGVFELEPHESILVNYTVTPTMYKDIH
jgi:hypothetical protein